MRIIVRITHIDDVITLFLSRTNAEKIRRAIRNHDPRMNYYEARSLSCKGLRVSDVRIECVQSRRLPFLAIIGATPSAAAEQRERVMAAIESSGFKIPRRRLTLRYGPDVHGARLECFDLAAALAILGSAGAFPPEAARGAVALGSLALNGSLRPAAELAPLREWLRHHPAVPVLLPWEESSYLGRQQNGGGFPHLAAVVEFLRSGQARGPRAFAPVPDLSGKEAEAMPTGLTAAEARLAEIAAAGGHHLLVVEGEEEASARIAGAVRAHLSRSTEERVVPLRRLREAQGARCFRFDRKAGTWGELSLAHAGVLHLTEFRNKGPALDLLFEAMREGCLRSLREGREELAPADVLVVAQAAPCECGGNLRRRQTCVCRPALKERKLRALAGAPFDLRCFGPSGLGDPARGQSAVAAVARARMRMRERQGKANGRLNLPEALRALPWSNEAEEWLRLGDRKLGLAESLARTALTVADLRDGAEVSRGDLLEAWHHVAGLEFSGAEAAGGFALGSSERRASVPEENCTAMP